MTLNPNLVAVGIANGGTVYADVTILGSAVPVAVVLETSYQMLDPPGFPSRPSFTGAATVQFPQTIANGTTLALLACEANALITAGAAVLG